MKQTTFYSIMTALSCVGTLAAFNGMETHPNCLFAGIFFTITTIIFFLSYIRAELDDDIITENDQYERMYDEADTDENNVNWY